MIGNLQVLRGFAALAVVFFHTGYVLPAPVFHTEFMAVPVFFVISGFVMTFINKSSATEFAVNRFTRIVPFYWLFTLFAFFWAVSGLENPVYTYPMLFGFLKSGDVAGAFELLKSNIVENGTPRLGMLLRSLAFVPVRLEDGPTIGAGWSLNLEVFYYAVFTACILIARPVASMLAAAVILAMVRPYADVNMHSSYLTYYNMYFASGIALFYVWRWLDIILDRYRWISGFAGALLIGAYLSTQANFVAILWQVCPVYLVLGALFLHSSGARMSARPLLFLGDASYSIYISHDIIIETARPISARWPWLSPTDHLLVAIALIGLSIAFGAIAHRYVEKPLIRFTRHLVRSRKRQVSPTPREIAQPTG